MSANWFFPSTTGRISTWPMPVIVTPGGLNLGWRKLDDHKCYLGLYN